MTASGLPPLELALNSQIWSAAERETKPMHRSFFLALLIAAPLLASRPARAAESLSLRQRLQHAPFKIAL